MDERTLVLRGARVAWCDSKCPQCGGIYFDAALEKAQALHDEQFPACGGQLVITGASWTASRELDLEQAQSIANVICAKLSPVCEKVAVAGSVRRGKDKVKDIEIVYVSKMEERRQDLFNWAPFPIAEDRIDDLRYAGFWQLDTQVKRNGSLYKRFRLGREGAGPVIELFRARPENWGLIYALRTGSSEFMKAVVTRRDARWAIGCMPTDMFMRDGDLWKMTPQGRQVIPTPTEEAFFGALALPVFPPSEREYERLLAWGVARGLKRMEGEVRIF